jgi:hypothetical protein
MYNQHTHIPSTFSSSSSNKSILLFSLWVSRLILRKKLSAPTHRPITTILGDDKPNPMYQIYPYSPGEPKKTPDAMPKISPSLLHPILYGSRTCFTYQNPITTPQVAHDITAPHTSQQQLLDFQSFSFSPRPSAPPHTPPSSDAHQPQNHSIAATTLQADAHADTSPPSRCPCAWPSRQPRP